MDYTKGFRIFRMKNSKKYFWNVWINVTTGITKKGYSSTSSSWNPLMETVSGRSGNSIIDTADNKRKKKFQI
ncbi:MAG: hypothetical protein HY753_03850 [Nitrospirae bacterium]|nr:hypothetical protein [Nitrospirota bacterium]